MEKIIISGDWVKVNLDGYKACDIRLSMISSVSFRKNEEPYSNYQLYISYKGGSQSIFYNLSERYDAEGDHEKLKKHLGI